MYNYNELHMIVGAVNAGKDDSAVNKGWRSSMFSFTSAFAWDPKTTSDPSPFIKLVKGMYHYRPVECA